MSACAQSAAGIVCGTLSGPSHPDPSRQRIPTPATRSVCVVSPVPVSSRATACAPASGPQSCGLRVVSLPLVICGTHRPELLAVSRELRTARSHSSSAAAAPPAAPTSRAWRYKQGAGRWKFRARASASGRSITGCHTDPGAVTQTRPPHRTLTSSFLLGQPR